MDQQSARIFLHDETMSRLPILIVDKEGSLGTKLAAILRDKFMVVIVTAKEQGKHDRVIHVPYGRKLPLIPDNAYSHILLFYHGEEDLLAMLGTFDQKAQAVKATLLLITSLLYSKPGLFQRIEKQTFQKLQTVIFGEIFDNEVSESNPTNFFIKQTRLYGRIEVPHEGLGKVYPVLLDDLISAILALAFHHERQTRPVLIFPHHIYNQVTVARVIQKINPLIKVDFTRRTFPSPRYYIPERGIYFYRNYRLDERLHKIDLTFDPRKSKRTRKKIKLSMPDPDIGKRKVTVVSLLLLAVFVVPVLFTVLCAFCGAYALQSAMREIQEGKLEKAGSTIAFAQRSFFAANALTPSMILPAIFVPNQQQRLVTSIRTGETIADTTRSILNSVHALQGIYSQQSLDPKNDFFKALATVKNSLLTIQKLEAENQLPEPILKKLTHYTDAIGMVEGTIDTWPTVLGFEGKKSYLILFQNNMELRPGGGFIGSFGTITIENGRSGKLQIHDVYDADGQLKESIDPPYGLRRYLGASHWYLRDSNFDPDFTVDARQAEKFLQKDTGQKADGVIAVDTTFLKELIAVVGSVAVIDYKEKVTPDNFYLLTQTHAEKDFFPGSTQKKDFLRSLTTSLLAKFTDAKHFSYEKLVQMLTTSIKEKHLLFAFMDQGVQDVFTVNHLSSSLFDERKSSSSTAFDFLGVIDANVGQNKANYYVKRSIIQFATIDHLGDIQETATATYRNTSEVASPFGGDYKDYARFLIPANAEVTGITIDGKAVQTIPAITDPALYTTLDFTPPSALEVDQGNVGGKKAVGFFFIVPAGQTKSIALSYRFATGIDTRGTAFDYNLRIFKQPGTMDDPYKATIVFPNGFTVVKSSDEFTNVGGKLVYEAPLRQDRDITASFSRK